MNQYFQGRQPLRLNLFAQAMLLAFPAIALAQAQADNDEALELEAVKITAERRETVVQKTPLTIGVIGADELDKTQFQHLFDIEKSVAGVTFYKGAANQQSNIIIRGVGTTNMGYTSAVSVYVDDVPLIRGGAAGQWDLPDIERIEVLKGPQGTLYGQNASAGAVRIISRDPNDEKIGWISAGLGNYSAFETRGYFSGPLKEGVLAGSLAFSHKQHDGYGKNLTTGEDIYTQDATLGRAKLRLTPGGGWDAVLAADALLDESDNGTKSPQNYGNSSNVRDSYSLKDLNGKLRRGGLNLRVSKELNGGAIVRSTTGWRYWNHDPSPMEHGGLPRISQDNENIWHQRIFYQDVQLVGDWGERLSYTAGLNFTREYFENDVFSQTSADGVNINRARRVTIFDTDDIAAYGQFDYRLTDRLTLTAGARYWRSEQEYDGASYTLDADRQVVAQSVGVSGLKKRSSGVTPRLTLGYQWTPDVYAYGSYTEGAKFGGYNRSASTQQVAVVAADPEKVNAYELGIKTSSFDRRLQVNGTLFYNEYKDYLSTIGNPVLNGVQYQGSVLTNAGKAVTYGAELEVRARLTRALNWNFNLAYLESEFKDFLNPSGSAAGDYTGNKLPFAPKYTLSTGLSYTLPFANGGELDLFGSVQYISEQEIDAANTNGQEVPSRTNVDIGANYRLPGGKWTATLRVRNLFDRDQILLKTYTPLYGIESAAYDIPRTFIVGLRYDF
ncbi:TonB-dependent receptor [Corticibacter populi]|uniref:TonB-dependent receptor n=1 Tax=Corticibacter populi TaxID=1550736 RepID=A0A3M6QS52_9BURK|nr:TonB-dependent receptor [Corticibacter populi]RMX05864.1 TonB-dependent receptor [Corticibacter populi]RZS30818.1 iron complex outermembrane receptor protein [Corticibacter populi]